MAPGPIRSLETQRGKCKLRTAVKNAVAFERVNGLNPSCLGVSLFFTGQGSMILKLVLIFISSVFTTQYLLKKVFQEKDPFSKLVK